MFYARHGMRKSVEGRRSYGCVKMEDLRMNDGGRVVEYALPNSFVTQALHRLRG
jgi:hypothetical protein